MRNDETKLAFGIPVLDDMIAAPAAKTAQTACLVGPDGCGKSILALHLASKYWLTYSAIEAPDRPLVIYVSTDFSYEQARRAWRDFGLDYPERRKLTLESHLERFQPAGTWKPESEDEKRCSLHGVSPEDDDGSTAVNGKSELASVSTVFNADISRKSVIFLDLQSRTAGDDWNFLNHLVGLLPKSSQPHLLIVDAVEGLEMFVGETDGFGEVRTRRSRVAQLVRTCAKANSHVAFVIEEPERSSRLPEQFVTDLVLRFAAEEQDEYVVRTVEIEKCRGASHARGKHEFAVRTGQGTRTGDALNVDTPEIFWIPEKYRKKKKDECGKRKETFDESEFPAHLAYFHVIPSIHYWNRQLRSLKVEVPVAMGFPNFTCSGMPQFGPATPVKPEPSKNHHHGSISVLLGDTGTYKSRLSRSFLASAFQKWGGNGIALLFTTGLMDAAQLHANLQVQLVNQSTLTLPPKYVVCRRLSIKYLSSANLLNIVEKHIRNCQRLLLDALLRAPSAHEELKDSLRLPKGTPWTLDGILEHAESGERLKRRSKFSHAIHVVLDDWDSLLASHPNIQRDTLLLPSLIALLKREGVSAMIVGTQPGTPFRQMGTAGLQSQDLRKLDEHQLLTWEVPFFGERRTALSVSSLFRQQPTPDVFELLGDGPEKVKVSRNFGLYSGLQTNSPRRVPLHVRLYGGPYAGHEVELGTSASRFATVLTQSLRQLFPAKPDADVVVFEPFQRYDDYFAFADWMDDVQLDHTLIFQIDEFWSAEKASLEDLTEYWEGETAIWSGSERSFQTQKDEDIHGVFLPHFNSSGSEVLEGGSGLMTPHVTSVYWQKMKAAGECAEKKSEPTKWTARRKDMFVSPFDGAPVSPKDESTPEPDNRPSRANRPKPEKSERSEKIDRIPFLWDFGVILARKDHWERCAGDMLTSERYVAQLWDSLCIKKPTDDRMSPLEFSANPKGNDPETDQWGEFLEACDKVAEANDLIPLDVDMNTAESFSCLILEVWGSYSMLNPLSPFYKLTDRRIRPEMTLRSLLNTESDSLLLAMAQVVGACRQLTAEARDVRRGPEPRQAAASREWYSTSAAIVQRQAPHQYRLLRLPGRLTTRGDWAIAMAAGSRSKVLGHRALDMLSSRRMTLLRLHDGLGLPPRDVLPDGKIADVQTGVTRFDPLTHKVGYLTYGEICSRGPQVLERTVCQFGNGNLEIAKRGTFDWLWRSRIKGYDRDCFYWRRWMGRMVAEKRDWLPKRRQIVGVDDMTQLKLDGKMNAHSKGDFEKADKKLDILRAVLRE